MSEFEVVVIDLQSEKCCFTESVFEDPEARSLFWNARGINDTTKREEMEDIFKKGRFDLFSLKETKLKWGEERYHGLKLMASFLVSRRWKELGKGWSSC